MREFKLALADFLEVIEREPQNHSALSYRGEIYQELGQYENSLADFKRVLELSPDNRFALVTRSATYQEMDEFENALTDANQVIELYPDYAFGYSERGATYLGLQEYEQALEDLNRALELTPNIVKAHRSRGYVYLALGRTDEAVEDFQKYLNWRPNDSDSNEIRQIVARLERQASNMARLEDAAPTGSFAGLTTTPIWTADGSVRPNHVGDKVVPAGDINGDGEADLIFVTRFGDNGHIFVYHGQTNGDGLPTIGDEPDLILSGRMVDGRIGDSVASAGDVNNDGYDDVVMSLAVDGEYSPNAAALYLGGSDGLNAEPIWQMQSDDPDDGFGEFVSGIGDVNGDGYDDVLVGAQWYDGEEDGLTLDDQGRVFLYLGTPDGLSQDAAWIWEGEAEDAAFGQRFGPLSDVNGDGHDDFWIVGGDDTGAWVYVFHGAENGSFSLVTQIAATEKSSVWIHNAVAGVGDVDGDGYADLLIGFDESDFGGEAHIHYGTPSGLLTEPSTRLSAQFNGEDFGVAVAATGDLNADSYADLLVGAKGAYRGEGRIYLFLGGPTGPDEDADFVGGVGLPETQFGATVVATAQLDESAARLVAVTDQEEHFYLFAVLDELTVDASAQDEQSPNWQTTAATPWSEASQLEDPLWTVSRELPSPDGDPFRFAGMAVGDVNGDGFQDLFIAAPDTLSTPDQIELFYGDADGVAAGPEWTTSGKLGDDGIIAATESSHPFVLHDFNGDGYDDLAMLARLPTRDADSRVTVFYGTEAGLGENPDLTLTQESVLNRPSESQLFAGNQVANDVNGDGFADLLVVWLFESGGDDRVFVQIHPGGSAGLAPEAIQQIAIDSVYLGGRFVKRMTSVVSEDLNSDGFADLLFANTIYGETIIYFGSRDGLRETPGLRLPGLQPTLGDFNGDGHPDLAVSGSGRGSRHGMLYVYEGSVRSDGTVGIHPLPSWQASSEHYDDHFGASMATMDLNGDGFDDLLVGAAGYRGDSGRMYAYLGSIQGLSLNPVGVIDGSDLNSRLGNYLTGAGDLNGDGLGDFVLLSIDETEDEATLFYQVYPGLPFETPLPTTVSVDESDALESSESGEVVLSGGPWQGLFGSSLTIIDLNTDGIDDLLIGEFPFLERTHAGRAYQALGDRETPLSALQSVLITSELDLFQGQYVANAADVNGDDVVDLLATVADFEQKQWSVQLLPGMQDSNGNIQYQLSHQLDSSDLVSNDEEVWPTAFGVGDLNGDGFADMAVSMPTGEESSTVLVYYGGSDFSVAEAEHLAGRNQGSGDQDGFVADWTLSARPTFGSLAPNVAGAGDVNGDGFADLLVAVPAADGFSEDLPTGDVVLYFGSADGLGLVPDWRIAGEDEREVFGFGMAAAGDVNDDGYSDIIIGVPGEETPGRALIYFGGSDGPQDEPIELSFFNQEEFEALVKSAGSPQEVDLPSNVALFFGVVVQTAGDMNGDGFADVVVGGIHPLSESVLYFVFYGDPNGINSTPGAHITGPSIGGELPLLPIAVGDVNSDGYSDLVVGRPFAEEETGQVSVLFGGGGR